MIHINRLVPEIYRESRDFRVFLKLLDMIVNVQKYDIDNWTTLYDPMRCPEKFLPLLADMIGYRYDTGLSTMENRVIMSEFNSILKNKGSEVGLRLAAALSMNAQLANDPSSPEYIRAVSQLQFLEMFYDYETGIIRIYYPSDLKKIRDIFKYVRPVGSFIELIKTEFPEPSSDFAISARATISRRKFTDEDYDENAINKAQINLSQLNRGDSTDTNNHNQVMNNYRPITIKNVTYDVESLNILKAKMLSGEYDKTFDINADGKLTYDDVDELRQLLLGLKNPKDTEIFKN